MTRLDGGWRACMYVSKLDLILRVYVLQVGFVGRIKIKVL